MSVPVVITGTGVAVPGAASAVDLLGPQEPHARPVDPADLLGRKGLRYKDRATRLGLCAGLLALRSARLWTDDGLALPQADVGVVVSSDFGNVDTVCRAVRTLRAETSSGMSPMDGPNLSSNVIASDLAMRFGLKGPNLTVCNGHSGGLDAVRWATVLVRAGRAGAVLVVGVEPDTEDARALSGAERLVDGAAAVVVETAESARERGAPELAALGPYARGHDQASASARLGPADLVLVPEGGARRAAEHDIAAGWGSASGALGVLQCAAAAAYLGSGAGRSARAVCGHESDAYAGLALTAVGAP
ncbi:beta-ketoacyl synthase N-terminal-like domain-containing protein [Actinokineospora guangxiensis]|uniref:Beta-ketoacyl synthase N-terminal-like domain-containing protein n=1 Tax=Actinokineospora guangxiensis TaxID=1490288 RepID=A0ABW0EL53_9PSEU